MVLSVLYLQAMSEKKVKGSKIFASQPQNFLKESDDHQRGPETVSCDCYVH